MRSSWHRGPIVGIGLEWGIPSSSPLCNLRRRHPASSLAVGEKGGDLTSPWSQISGLSVAFMQLEYMSLVTYRQVVSVCQRPPPTSLNLTRYVGASRFIIELLKSL